MNIIVGCEESQTVCIEFRKQGHEAYSCDIHECSGGHPEWHFKMDVFQALKGGSLITQSGETVYISKWDMGIVHPVCTKIALCGNSTYGAGMHKNAERIESIEWTKKLWETVKSCTDKAMMENPKNVMGRYVGKRTQAIQPFEYGHLERKETWLWLHGLPNLVPTNNVYGEMMLLPKKVRERIHYMSPSGDRGKLRSKTFQGIAQAMADQWNFNKCDDCGTYWKGGPCPECCPMG